MTTQTYEEGARLLARGVCSPQFEGPMKELVPVERGTNRLNQMLYKSVLNCPVWTHDRDKKTRRVRPSTNKPYEIGKQIRCQPQWISHKTCLPRPSPTFREEGVQATAFARVDDTYLHCAQQNLTG